MANDTNTNVPGLILTAVIAVVAFYIQHLPFPPFTIGDRHPIDALLIAIVLGMVIRNTFTLTPSLGPGIQFSVKKVLPFAIVLMGAKLDFTKVLEVSAQGIVISVVCVLVALGLTIWLCNRVGVGQKLGLLIGVARFLCN